MKTTPEELRKEYENSIGNGYIIERTNDYHHWLEHKLKSEAKEDATKDLLATIISWEMYSGEYMTLETKLRKLYKITKP